MDLLVGFALSWVVISFYLYWPVFFKQLRVGKKKYILLTRYYGALIFGLVPILFYVLVGRHPLTGLGLTLPQGDLVWHLLAILLLMAAVPVSFYQAKSKQNLDHYPQIREVEWTSSLIIHNAVSWMVYLVGYEILYRGLLWFPLQESFGVPIAMLVNLGFYSITHSAKSFREGLATLPIGFLLLLLAWKTESIFYAVLVHWTMALCNSFFSVRHHPNMKFVIRK